MTFDELSEEQKLELKQRILAERNERRGEGTSYGELADADGLVSDEDAKDWAEGVEFSPDDFSCSASAPVEKVENVPQWAASYLVNGDASGLETYDKSLVDEWTGKLRAEGLELLAPVDGSENEFCSAPAFGLACGTVDFAARRTKGKD